MATNEERRKQHRHAHKQRVLRGISDELAADFDAATKAAGSDRSSITRQLWEWYLDKPGAALPERPTSAKPTKPGTLPDPQRLTRDRSPRTGC